MTLEHEKVESETAASAGVKVKGWGSGAKEG